MKTRGRPENATQGEFRFDVASTLYTPGHDLALSPQLSELSQRPYNTPTRPRTIAGRFVGQKECCVSRSMNKRYGHRRARLQRISYTRTPPAKLVRPSVWLQLSES